MVSRGQGLRLVSMQDEKGVGEEDVRKVNREEPGSSSSEGDVTVEQCASAWTFTKSSGDAEDRA